MEVADVLVFWRARREEGRYGMVGEGEVFIGEMTRWKSIDRCSHAAADSKNESASS